VIIHAVAHALGYGIRCRGVNAVFPALYAGANAAKKEGCAN
jgi:hypothetical protein